MVKTEPPQSTMNTNQQSSLPVRNPPSTPNATVVAQKVAALQAAETQRQASKQITTPSAGTSNHSTTKSSSFPEPLQSRSYLPVSSGPPIQRPQCPSIINNPPIPRQYVPPHPPSFATSTVIKNEPIQQHHPLQRSTSSLAAEYDMMHDLSFSQFDYQDDTINK